MSTYGQVMGALLGGEPLGREDSEALMGEVLDGALGEAATGALLGVLAARGPTGEMLAGFATAMRARAVPLPVDGPLVDTCGTGGSGLDTVNTSTAVALVLAAAGLRVAKHGNRASSGRCGSADVLEALGVAVDLSPPAAASLLDRHGFAFLFAPRHHPALRPLGPIRRQLGFRTVFNLLGPLCNPAPVQAQVLGVSDGARARLMAEALAGLGCRRALVVHGEDGLDELTLCAPTRAFALHDGQVTEAVITPEAVGLNRVAPEAIRGGDVARNVALLTAILEGAPGPHADLVALNAGAALQVAGQADGLGEGVALAREVLRSGEALGVLRAYAQDSRRVA